MRRTNLFVALTIGVALVGGGPIRADIQFVETSAAAGVSYQHGWVSGAGESMPKMISGGVAAGDYDGDGFVDLFVVKGDMAPTALFHNLGDGTFEEVAAAAGVQLSGGLENGPAFGDLDGDGWLDLIVGGVEFSGLRLFRNQGDGTFAEITDTAGLEIVGQNTFSAALGDYDLDGDLDVLLTHWTPGITCTPDPCGEHLWRNNGDLTFTDMDVAAGLTIPVGKDDRTFTPNFADINNDGWPDILIAADFGNSKVYLNNGDGTFLDATDPNVQTDQNGMGATVADVNNDGDLDWYITSIFNPAADPPKTGNRLLVGQGDGSHIEVSEAASVQDGAWGWGACATDLDNDGMTDLVHVNGWNPPWENDPARIFRNLSNGQFNEVSAIVDFNEAQRGRGIVCFDYDRDGDIDIFVANNEGMSALWRNDGANDANWLDVSLRTQTANRWGVGARISAVTGAGTQTHELRMGSNFVSQDPTEAHFGVGAAPQVDRLDVRWPDGVLSQHSEIPTRQGIEVELLTGAADTTVLTGGKELWIYGGCDLCQVEATLELTSLGMSGVTAGAMAGWFQDAGTYVMLALSPDLDKVMVRQMDGGALVAVQTVSFTVDEGVSYALSLRFDGNDFEARVDGQLLMTVPNAAAGTPSGEAALLSVNADVTRHNLAITRATEQ